MTFPSVCESQKPVILQNWFENFLNAGTRKGGKHGSEMGMMQAYWYAIGCGCFAPFCTCCLLSTAGDHSHVPSHLSDATNGAHLLQLEALLGVGGWHHNGGALRHKWRLNTVTRRGRKAWVRDRHDASLLVCHWLWLFGTNLQLLSPLT